jgi:hypothetical protein
MRFWWVNYRVFASITASVCASCALATPSSVREVALLDPIAGGTVTSSSASLRFDWPVGLTGRVRRWSEEVRRSPIVNERLETEDSCRLTVEQAEAGRLIHYTDCSAQIEGNATPRREVARLLYGAGIGVDLPIVVSDAGALVGVYGIAELRRTIDAFFAVAFAHLPEGGQGAHEVVAPWFTEEQLIRSADHSWSDIVGMWVGARLEQDELYLADKMLPVATASGGTMREMFEVTLAGRERCKRANVKRQCVRLEVVRYPESGVLRDASEENAQKMMPAFVGLAASESVWVEISVVERSTLVTEADTLIPHELTSKRSMRGKIRLPDGSIVPIEETTVAERTYEYD